MTEQPTYWLAEYEGAEPELWTTQAEAIEACDDLARAEGQPWDWITQPDGTQQMVHINPDNDRPTGEGPGRVTPLTLQTSSA